MTQKTYRLSNGVVLETEAELKAYIRGLEIARTTSEGCTAGRDEFLSKMSAALEEGHVAKNEGSKTPEEWAEVEIKASAAKAAAEKPAEEEKTAAAA